MDRSINILQNRRTCLFQPLHNSSSKIYFDPRHEMQGLVNATLKLTESIKDVEKFQAVLEKIIISDLP